MFKKLMLVGVIAAASVFVLKGTKFFGYARHEAASLREWADDQVPVEKKIAQMRKEVRNLDKDADAVTSLLAKEIVEVRDLTAAVAQARADLDAEAKALAAKGQALKDGTVKVSAGGGDPVARFGKDVDLHKKRQANLATQEKTLERKERLKAVYKAQLDGVTGKKAELLAEIDTLEVEYKELQLAQIESRYQTDDTRLARIKDTLQQMKKKVEVEKTKLELTQKVRADKPADGGQPESVDAILARLNAKAGE